MDKASARETERDKYPLFCLSFSPNWNTYQILSLNEKGQLAYGTNTELFMVDILNKDFLTSVKPEENLKYTQFKVTAVLLNESILYAGYSNGMFYAFNHKLNNEIIFKLKISQNPIMHIIRLKLSEEKYHLLIIDSEGAIYDLLSIDGIQKQINLKITGYGGVVRAWAITHTPSESPIIVLMNYKGVLSIWNFKDEKELFKYDSKSIVYAADLIEVEEGVVQLSAITKKENLLIFDLNLKKILKGILGTEAFKIHSTKLHFQIESKHKGDQEILHARGNLIYLDNTRLLVSGKTGELYKIPVENLLKNQTLNLKHLSAELEEDMLYEVVERNTHYKQIYAMTKYKNPLNNKYIYLTLGIDRILNFWLFDENNPVNDFLNLWDISFLGGKITQIYISELEKNKIFLTSNDKIIRIWDLEKKNNKFSTQEIWKQVSQTLITHMALSPAQEGIAVYATEDKKICLFDLPNSICVKVMKTSKGIKNLYWIRKEDSQHFINLTTAKNVDKKSNSKDNAIIQPEDSKEEQKTETEIKDNKMDGEKDEPEFTFVKASDSKFTKTFDPNYLVLARLEDATFMIWDPATNQPQFYKSQALHDQDSFAFKNFGNGVIIATGSKNGECHFWFSQGNEIELIASYANHIYHISSLAFSYAKDGPLLCVTSSHDRKIVVYEVAADPGEKWGIKIIPRIFLKHKNKVSKIKFSIANYLLAIAVQDKTVQVWNCNITEEDRKSSPENPHNVSREICNVRGHDGYITDAEFSLNDANILVTASDDQTIKIWNMYKIVHKTLANKKKKNKKKKTKQGGNSKKDGEMDHEESRGDQDESGEEIDEEESEK